MERGRTQSKINTTQDMRIIQDMLQKENSQLMRSKAVSKARDASVQNRSMIKSGVMMNNQISAQTAQQQLQKLISEAQQIAAEEFRPQQYSFKAPRSRVVDPFSLNVSAIQAYPDIIQDASIIIDPLIDDVNMYQIAGNKLQFIRQTLLNNNKVLFPDKVGKYSTDIYGIRRDEPQYKQMKANKMYNKALTKDPQDFQTAMLANVQGVDSYNGTSETFAKFADIKYNTSGQILYNNSIIGWKKLVKQLGLSKYETRGPVVIYFKRLAQMARATVQLINYMGKNKNIQQAIARENDPRQILRKKYATLKKYFTNMVNDPRRQTDYDYKMKQIMQTNANKRNLAIQDDYNDVIHNQSRIYDMVMARRDAIRRAYGQPMQYAEN